MPDELERIEADDEDATQTGGAAAAGEAAEGAGGKPEIDWETVDPDEIPQHLLAQTSHSRGLVRDLTDARRARQELGEELAKRGGSARADDEKPEEGGNDDEPMTRGEMKRALARDREDRKREEAQRDLKTRKEREDMSVEQLTIDKSVAKVGKGLDAETVLRIGGAWLRDNEPAIYDGALSSRDPARKLYDLALTLVPALRKRAEQRRTETVLDKVKTGGPRGGRGGARGSASSAQSQLDKLLNATPDQLEELEAQHFDEEFKDEDEDND